MSILLAHYSSGPLTINSETVREEWKEFKAQSNLDIASIKDQAEFLLSSSERSEIFPLLSHLLVCGLLPVATADCERAFPAMNRITTCPQNRLNTITLKQFMFLSIEGPSFEDFVILFKQPIIGEDEEIKDFIGKLKFYIIS